MIKQYIKTCFHYEKECCIQELGESSLQKCKTDCNCYNFIGHAGREISDCYYQLVRNSIRRGDDIMSNLYYQQLQVLDSKTELDAIQRMIHFRFYNVHSQSSLIL